MLRSTSYGGIYFGGHPLEAYSSTKLVVALSTSENDHMSMTRTTADGMKVRSAMMECGLTLIKVVCETDPSFGRANGHKTRRRPRASSGYALAEAVVWRRCGGNAIQTWRAPWSRPGCRWRKVTDEEASHGGVHTVERAPAPKRKEGAQVRALQALAEALEKWCILQSMRAAGGA